MPDPQSTSVNTPDIKPDYVDAAPPAAMRPGECVPNVPDVRPDLVGAKDLPPPAAPAAGAADTDIEPSRGLAVPRWLRWGYVAATLVLMAVFGLFLFSQAISSLALARTLPEWARYLLLVPLAFCGLVLLAAGASLVWSWLRLKTFRQINLKSMEELRLRAESRKDGLERFQAARQKLERYLRDYPLTGREAGRLAAAGFPDAELDALHRNREHLLSMTADSKTWLDDFRRLFQDRLDKTAAGRVGAWSLKAAGCVMASPLPLLDAVLVLTISLRMIRDLCAVYNIRTGNATALLLFARSIRNAFIAGVADEAGNAAGDMLGDQVSQMLGDSAFGALGSSIARFAAPKLGEGALNALFMRRLGKAAIGLLQPLKAR